MLRDLTIQGYRCFGDFSVDGLARVNLIVGANNSGKTSLLEAIYLLSRQDDKNALPELLHARGEYVEFSNPSGLTEYQYQISHLFHGHQPRVNSETTHGNTFGIATFASDSPSLHAELKVPDPLPSGSLWSEYLKSHAADLATIFSERAPLELVLRYGALLNEPMRPVQYPVTGDLFIRPGFLRFGGPYVPRSFVTTRNIDFAYLARLWDAITLTSEEDRVLAALRILEPDIEGVRFTSQQTSNSGVVIKLRPQSGPIPLGSMGEGMLHVLALAMSAVTARDDVLLVDEIDTGLYYGVLADVWDLLIETAQRLNVQIFATTHSWDCVAAFQEALSQQESQDVGRLFRLEERKGTIQAVAYDADDLAVAVRQAIEVR